MIVLDRDRLIVLSVARFEQLTASHLRMMHFHAHASMTPLDRALKRLVARGYLKRLQRREIGGTGAGSGPFIYQLGPKGWTLAGKEKKYWPMRAVNYHTLAIADAYVDLLRLEKAGRLRIDGFSTEPDSWTQIGGIVLRPDLFIDIADIHRRRNVSYWVEVDMGSERKSQILEKVHAYIDAVARASSHVPYVLFIAPDLHRARELREWLKSSEKKNDDLFMVVTADNFADLMFS